jgi:type IV secretory pathway protease TraF
VKRVWLGVVLSLTGAVLVVLLLAMVSHAMTGRRFYVNGGVSLPKGLYACTPVALDVPLFAGTLLQLAPTADARAIVERLAPTELRTAFWMKRLVAQAGQRVCLQDDDVLVDGVVIAARPLLKDYALPLVNGCWTLSPADVFVLGTHAQSWDARYTGPWARAAVHGTCEALWTWEGKP